MRPRSISLLRLFLAGSLALLTAASVSLSADLVAQAADPSPEPAKRQPAPADKDAEKPADKATDKSAADKPSPDKPATDKPAPKPGNPGKSLDKSLLDDLTGDLFDGLDPPPKPTGGKAADSLDDELMKGLGDAAGEDIGQPKANPLVELARRMQRAESLLDETRLDDATQKLQADIVADLDKLIQQARQQSQQQSKSSSGQQANAERQQVQQPGQPAGSQPAAEGGNRPAQDSTDRLGQAAAEAAERQAALDLMKQVWGHLPAHVREALPNVSAEQVLPKYELMIRQYFERLAEMEQSRP